VGGEEVSTLWVIVIRLDISNDVAEVSIVEPDANLATSDALVVEKSGSPTNLQYSVWPHVVGTLWRDQVRAGKLLGTLDADIMRYIVRSSFLELETSDSLTCPPSGVRSGTKATDAVVGVQKYLSMRVDALNALGASFWQTKMNVFIDSDIVLQVLMGSRDATGLLERRAEFKVLKEDILRGREHLRLNASRAQIRGRGWNDLLKVGRLVEHLPEVESFTLLTLDEEKAGPAMVDENGRRIICELLNV
jgi:hypothetical protein